MEICFNLAGYGFRMESEDEFLKDFIVSQNENVLSHIKIHKHSSVSGFFGIEALPAKSEIILRDSRYGDIAYSDKNFNKFDICFSAHSNPQKAVLLAAVYSRLCFENVLLCHASLIDYKGHGILFVGPSGIGKTTQAELWQSFRGADIINGDKAFLKTENGELSGFGLPWKGSSDYCLNRSVKIDAVVVLRQSKSNRIRKLTEAEKLSCFVPHIFLPHWNESCMNSALKTLDKTVSSSQVYLLECLPDEEAVSLTETAALGLIT